MYEIKIIEDIEAEPITLAEVKSFLRIDSDFSSEDSVLELLITASREILENHLNLSFGLKKLQVQFTGGCFDLPAGPHHDIESLYPVNDETYPEEITDYTITGLAFKTIHLDSVEDNLRFFYPIAGGPPELWSYENEQGRYNIVFNAGYETLPKALKNALLTQVDYAYKSLGQPNMEPLSPVALQLSATYSKNLVL